MKIGKTKMRLFPFILMTGVVLLSVIFSSCKENVTHADIVFYNGKIITADKDFSIVNAIAVKGDKILAVGSDQEILKLSNEQTKIRDLGGKAVIPGLIDAHAHPDRASISELDEVLPDLHTLSGLMEWIEQQAEEKEDGEWIILPKFFYTRLVDLRRPLLDEIDKVAPNNPVFLNGSFGGVINTAAIIASELTESEMADSIGKDPETGKLTGFIRASDFKLLKLPPQKELSLQEKQAALKNMFKNYNKYGITGIVLGYSNTMDLKLYQNLHQKGELDLRLTQNFLLPSSLDYSRQSLADTLKKFPVVTGDGDEWINTGAIKIFLDGGILTGTAFLRQPWGEKAAEIYDIRDPDYRGVINYSYQDLLNIVGAACETGWTFTVHCTGGGGVDLLLDVFEEINNEFPVKDLRFSIIHGNFFTEEAIQRMKKLGIIGNVQAAWFYKDADAMKVILGDDRIRTFNPYLSMIEGGVVLSGGSDHMVKLDANASINPYNPFLAMWSMITRKTERGNIVCPEESISREEALKMYTINNAYLTFEESVKGSLEPGKLADMAVLSDDILDCPVENIKDIQAELTMVGGRIVYEVNE